MGFFSDLKEDLSQAVNELVPEELVEPAKNTETEPEKDIFTETKMQAEEESIVTEDIPDDFAEGLSLEEMLKNIDDIQIPEEEPAVSEGSEDAMDTSLEEALAVTLESLGAEENPVTAQEESWFYKEPVEEAVGIMAVETTENTADSLPEEAAFAALQAEETNADDKGEEEKMDSYTSRQATDETSVITAGMKIKGDVTTEGSMDVIGTVEGDIDVWGKLNVTGHITGNSQAAEVYAEGAKITGEIVSAGAVKIGNGSVIIGNITAKSAAIAGAVKGDIDVQGPVILDVTAIVMGNIKSKSVQINNGAVIEGMCSQCYADVSPLSFFDEYKTEIKNSSKKNNK